MSKRKDGVFSLLRHIIGNQKKIIKEQENQTKILQAIESSKEQEVIISDEEIHIKAPEITLNGKKVSHSIVEAIRDTSLRNGEL